MNVPSPPMTRSERIGYWTYRRPFTLLLGSGLVCVVAMAAVLLALGESLIDAVAQGGVVLVAAWTMVALAILPWMRPPVPRPRVDRAEYVARSRESAVVRLLPEERQIELWEQAHRDEEQFRRTRPWRVVGLVAMVAVGVAYVLLVDPRSIAAVVFCSLGLGGLAVMLVVRSMARAHREALDAAVGRPGGAGGAGRGPA